MMRKKLMGSARSMVFLCALLGAFTQAHGQREGVVSGTSETTAPAASSTSKIRKPKKTTEALQTKIGAELSAISYTSESPVDSSFLQQIEVGLNLKKEGRFFSNTDIRIGTFSTPHTLYYAFPEAYMGYGDKKSSVTAGRKIENLSFADSFFHLGLVQAYSTNDYINYTEGGLTGIAAHYDDDGMGFDIGFNPIFIPNQGPQVKAEDGKIISGNRWATQPPKEFKFGDQNKEIIYAIRDYKITDIIMNSGYIARAFVGGNSARPVLSAMYAHKPVNELALSRDTFGDISTFQGNVILTPVVLTHEVYAADLNLDYGNIKSTLSYVGDKPNNKTAPELETMQTLSPLTVASLYVGLNLSEVFGKKMEVYLAAAEMSGGEIKDLTADGKEGSFTFATGRSQFKRPVKVGVKGEMFFIYNQAFEADTSLTYDQVLKGSLLSIRLGYAPTRQLKVSLGADIIGTENELADGAESNFLDQNQANDRISTGVGYVF